MIREMEIITIIIMMVIIMRVLERLNRRDETRERISSYECRD
jgi:hypothetical protein